MTPALDVVLQIAATGSGLLFAALAGLIGLMYLLTSTRLFGGSDIAGETQELPAAEEEEDTAGDTETKDAAAEADRRRRAAALAVSVAVACARAGRTARRAVAAANGAPSEWRRTGHMRRLSQPRRRTGTGA